MMIIIFFSYFFILLSLTIFSYGFVDANFPLKKSEFLFNLVHWQRPLATMIYIIIVALLFGIYGYLLYRIKRGEMNNKQVWRLIFLTVGTLFLSFPAFSYDIFNYIATAKATFFYKENPYLVMPIEFIGDPMLKFTHAVNKTALYGPVWILLTAIPHISGVGNIIFTVFTFKAFIAAFYLGAIWLIWKLSEKNLVSLVFFAFNPLVLIETLVSSHNDIVMMTLALFGLQFFVRKKKIIGLISLVGSIGIKYATVVLLPVFLLKKKVDKEKIFIFCYWLMFLVFLTAPLREEIYPWYIIWLITFAALVPKDKFVFWFTLALSLGTLFRYTPFLYTGSWEGMTPLVKKIVTIVPPFLVIFSFLLRKLWSKRFFLSL